MNVIIPFQCIYDLRLRFTIQWWLNLCDILDGVLETTENVYLKFFFWICPQKSFLFFTFQQIGVKVME